MNTKLARPAILLGAALMVIVWTGCSGGSSGSGAPETSPLSGAQGHGGSSSELTPPARVLGDPIGGLTDEEKAAFERGRIVFDRRFTPSEGLGPFYNATSCASCHSTPVSGGSSGIYRNFYLAVYGTVSFQSSAIPPFLSAVVPSYGTGDVHATSSFSLEGPRTSIPDEILIGTTPFPVIQAMRNSIPIFGTGLFEFVSNDTIMSNADPLDLDGDGIRGRHNTQIGNVGRLGLKAQSNNIELFVRGPLQNQMGITSNPFLGEGSIVSMSRAQVAADPNDPTVDNDGVPDPEISHEDLGDLIAFTRFLAPPQPKPFNASAARGEKSFKQIGCVKCHVPSLPSSRGPVKAYSNLLLHYMGTSLADDIQFGDAFNTARFFRTQPLWGVSHFPPWLHDGRAETLDEAIMLHDGEALLVRNTYAALADSVRTDIITFLEHL